MAVKDHSLDSKILETARAEFLEHGYSGASLHKIAARAGISTGAFYTRYSGKDELFRSIVMSDSLLDNEEYERVQMMYFEAHNSHSVDKFLEALRAEERLFMELLFDHYDDCVLVMCKSEGSSIARELSIMMEKKSRETVEFFRTMANDDIDIDGLALIIEEQFHYYRAILDRGYPKAKAVSMMRTVETFFEEGWSKVYRDCQHEG